MLWMWGSYPRTNIPFECLSNNYYYCVEDIEIKTNILNNNRASMKLSKNFGGYLNILEQKSFEQRLSVVHEK